MTYIRNRNENAASNSIEGIHGLEDDRLDNVTGGVVPGDGGCIPPWLDKIIHRLPFPLPTPTFPKL